MSKKSSKLSSIRIRESAQRVTGLLKREQVDLTIGGEPTFVPIKPEGNEWGPDAIGPTKIIYARKMARAFLEAYHPGALISLHSGKHYPGEPIPRWQLTVQWRKERKLWRSLDRLLLEPLNNPKAPVASARKMMKELAGELKLTPYIRNLLESGASTPKAWVLPLTYESGWKSASWVKRGTRIELIPGDSSVGLRMPLDDLVGQGMRTALTVSACLDGAMEIFIPPMEIQHYDKLIRILERVANRLDARNLVISGYRPEGSDDSKSLSMVSDPGVLEVNLPPASTWNEHRKIIKQVYASAKSVGLRAEKFLHNGEHHGTGGGSHLCFGGTTPAQSPFITIPHLLPSIIRYWNQHPSLSYLFTGQFIGPGCQAPRVDESNPHLIPELEIALQDIPKTSWNAVELHQRLIHFFIDASGNTHRSEISMDKLSNPLLPNGNLGIIEFRAIESQPDPDSWNRIVLLFQSLIAMLAKRPCTTPLQVPDHRFQDTYFLPSALEADLASVLKDLKKIDVALTVEDYRSHLQRRFPVLGQLRSGKAEVKIRQALESWPLLSELPSGQSTTRPVDSSFARIECKLNAGAKSLAETTYLRVNGKPFAFRALEKSYLLGLKFRTFNQPYGFHPHIPGQCPLFFEWVDHSSGKVLDAGTWHHWNPHGEIYKDRPKDHKSAEKLRHQRWVPSTSNQTYPVTIAKKSAGSLVTEDLRQIG